MVSFRDTDGKVHGNGARRFGARRSEGRRYHAGVDLYGTKGELLVACEDGTIANHYYFYRTTYALFVQCDSGLVINYGEVLNCSWHSSSMCHFETYVEGTKKNQRLLPDQHAPAPLDPTAYLLHLAASGK